MGLNLIDMAKDALTSQVIGKASEFLGEDAGMLSKGFGAAVPSILGAIVGKSSDTSGAGHLLGMLKEGGFDGGMLDNLGDIFSGGAATSGVLDSGGGLLKMFLGDKIGNVADIISKVSGIGQGSSNKVLSLVAPMIMSMIGKVVKNKALDAIGLGKLLGNQKSHLASALPAGMGSLLGLDGLLGGAKDTISKTVGVAANRATSTASTVSKTATAATKEVATTASSGLMKWAIPALIALGAFLAYQQGCFSKAVDATKDATSGMVDAAKDGMDKAGDMASGAAATIGDAAGDMKDAVAGAAAKALEGISFVAGSVGDQFSQFLASGGTGDQSFKFNNLNFASGSGTIEGATTEIDNLAAVLKAYPDVSIEINGYTDSQGNDDNNQALSELRANTVLQKLVANGIDVSRLSAVGHGEANPIGDNNTAEGRAMNRRIEIKVTSK